MSEARPATVDRATVGVPAGADLATSGRTEGPLGQRVRSTSLTRDALRRVARNPGAIAGAIVLAVMVLLALFAPAIAPYDPIDQDSQSIRARPSLDHFFGAD